MPDWYGASIKFKGTATLAVLFLGQFSFASQEPVQNVAESTAPSININANDLSVSLNSIGGGYGTSQGVIMTMGPRVEYFVIDRLALGLQTGFSTTAFSSNQSDISIGPAATYHFWNTMNLSAYTGASFVFGNLVRNSGAVTRTLGLNVGANYNFASWFGVGPRLTYNAYLYESESISTVKLDAINLYFYF